MSELMFPGGLVRGDESHVWRELSRWLGDGERSIRAWSTDGVFFSKLECRTSGDGFRGSSKLGLGDAVAQALQAAYAKHEHTPLGD